MFRFFKDFDPDENSYTGGTTICECCTKTLNCTYLKDWIKKRRDKKLSENECYEEDAEDEFEQTELKRKPSSGGNKESKNCCVICCKAVFCCKTRNDVDKEVEMSELRQYQNSNGE